MENGKSAENKIDWSPADSCKICDGTGIWRCTINYDEHPEDCPICDGYVEQACPECKRKRELKR